MLLSHERSFIYVKTVKTAGTAAELLFEPFCVADPEGFEPEHSRELEVSERGIVGSRRMQGKRQDEFWNHMPPRQIAQKIGRDIWDRYFKFANIRNPWDKYVSYWFYSRNRSSMRADADALTPEAMDELVAAEKPMVDLQIFWPNFRMDFYVRFEHLRADLEHVAARIGVQLPAGEWPRPKAGLRPPDARDYRRYFSDESRRIVAERYAAWIEAGRYSF